MKATRLTLILLFTFIYIFLVLKYFHAYSADVFFERSDDLLTAGNFTESIELINNAVKRNPNEPLYYRGRAKSYISATVGQDTTTERTLRELALADLEKAYSLNPKNYATIRNSVPLYYFLAIDDLGRPGSSDNVDPEFLPYTKDYYNKVERLAGNDVGIYVLLAKYQNKLGLKEDLKRSVNKITELRPDLLNWHESLRDLDVSL